MKMFLGFAMTLVSLSALADAGTDTRIEWRSRVIGENLVGVSRCSPPSYSAIDHDVPIVNNNGEVRVNKDGSLRSHHMTAVTAVSGFTMRKCQTVERYQVKVAGHFWNSKSEEIPNTAQRRGEVLEQISSFPHTADLNIPAMTRGMGSFERMMVGDGTVATFALGLATMSSNDCNDAAALLERQAVSIRQTACGN